MSSATDRLAALPRRRPGTALLLAVVGCVLVGASGSVFTASGLGTWYAGLEKPALAPPDWVFGPVWTVLFALMGVAAWLVWRQAATGEPAAARLALGVFAAHFAVNVAWSAAFFGARSVRAGLVVVALLWVAVVATIATFARVDRRAALLLVPYFAWVTFAAYLNYAFWSLN